MANLTQDSAVRHDGKINLWRLMEIEPGNTQWVVVRVVTPAGKSYMKDISDFSKGLS